MIVGTNDMKTVSLQTDQLWLKQTKDMTLFRITEQRFSFINATNPEQGIQMSIVLKRKIMAELLTTFFPSILLTLITFATTLFKPIYFEASLSVNLTTMLVMTTIFISKMDGLPPTSAIKMIDIWLIMCQLVPFCEVVLLTAIEYNSGGEQGANGEKQKTINHHGKMRVIKMGESSNDSDNHEKPEKAWGLDEDNDSLTMWFPNLKSIRKYHHFRLKLGTATSHIRSSSIEKFAETVDISRI